RSYKAGVASASVWTFRRTVGAASAAIVEPARRSCIRSRLKPLLQGVPANAVDRTLPGVLDARGDPVHGGEQGVQQLAVGRAFPAPAGQQVDLQQADGVDVRVAQADRLAQSRVAREQLLFILDREDGLAGALELGGDAGVHLRVQVALGEVPGQARVALEDA